MAKSIAYVLVGSLKYVCSPLLRIQGELLETMSIVVPQGLVFLFPQTVLSALKSLNNKKGLGSWSIRFSRSVSGITLLGGR